MEHISLKQYIRERLSPVLTAEPPGIQDAYIRACTKEHRDQLDTIVKPLLTKHRLRLRFDEVVYHDEFKTLRLKLPPPMLNLISIGHETKRLYLMPLRLSAE